ncbi:hypothetical protein ACQKGD_04785 [Peribacillus frigoritolerans]|uniref:hypothetical protein n=1 Tax=Peribacillus frigoritolerans TaxID=450367 RepID=UPI0007BF85D4|nr:hypothetical protein [Peribacillus frigoritolerans]USK65104.1 hypothetical protein LIT26_29175 [Peribacillus frigoritolerans]
MLKKFIFITLSFFLILGCIFQNPKNSESASTAKINEYISIKSVTRNSNGTITVKYDMKKKFNPGSGALAQRILIGYEWPSKYRGKLKNYTKTVSYSKGTNKTLSIPKPSAHVGKLNVKVYFKSSRYNESKSIKTIFHAPYDKKVKYHTVTSTEATGRWIAFYAAPAIFLEFHPTTKKIKWAGRAYLSWSLWDGFAGANNLSTGFPKPVKGQYYKITTYYTSNGRINTNVLVWKNKTSFNKNATPINGKSGHTTYYQF